MLETPPMMLDTVTFCSHAAFNSAGKDQVKCVVLHEGRTCFIVGVLERPEN
ncbi:hypothetical protein DPMN_082220 [Dreissena polymorpha]|uniref:Uncharacterized protein n=1 Tax=Dreissena polymorpha TaxID=45954 RepID=A0A9D4BH92_DREPO|nr:hypothetical protein DPMN_082220 [Dreissena polymorpha]